MINVASVRRRSLTLGLTLVPGAVGAWGRELGANGKVRMLADGSAAYTKALGLELDLTARGMGIRCQRFSMLVDDGVVKTLNVEAPGK